MYKYTVTACAIYCYILHIDDRNRLTLDPMNHPDCQYDYINASYIDVSYSTHIYIYL